MPRSVVDGDMDVADSRRDGERRWPEDLHDPQVLGTILNVDAPFGQGFGDRRINDQPCGRFAYERDDGRRAAAVGGGPNISLADCADAVDTVIDDRGSE